MWNRFKKDHILIAFILIIAFALRIYQVNNLSLYGDELTIGLDSYSILKTGHSSTGQFLPLTFDMGEGRPGGYVYGSVPFVALFGPSIFGIRALSILSGLVIIFLAYLLGRRLIGRNVGLVAAGLMAISPWDLSLSRGGFEAHFALLLSMIGVYTYLLSDRNKWFLPLSALSFGLTIHTYPTYKLVLPFFLIILIWYKGPRKMLSAVNNIYGGLAGIILAIFITLAVMQTLVGGSEERFENINIFARGDLRETIIQKINLDRSLTKLPLLSSLIHNKPVEYGFLLKKSYLDNFSTDFLFLLGDQNPRHNMTGMGSFYLIEILTLAVGLYYLFRYKKRVAVLLVGWILIAPLATSLLVQTHALRSAFMLPALILISATGFVFIWSQLRHWPIFKILLILGFVVQFMLIAENLYFLLPNKYDHFWSGPAKTAAELALSSREDFEAIILSDKIDNAEYAYPVYGMVNPSEVIEQNRQKVEISGYQFKQYGNVYIGSIPKQNVDQLVSGFSGRVLYIGSAGEIGELNNFSVIQSCDKQDALVVKKYPNPD